MFLVRTGWMLSTRFQCSEAGAAALARRVPLARLVFRVVWGHLAGQQTGRMVLMASRSPALLGLLGLLDQQARKAQAASPSSTTPKTRCFRWTSLARKGFAVFRG